MSTEGGVLSVTEEAVHFPPGVARIKPQYIVSKRPLEHSNDDNGDTAAKPPPKKKSRGQNKYRPSIKIPFSAQLCPTFHIGSHRVCKFGDKCHYFHDIPKFLELKPSDIGDTCYVFETYGFCPSGLACRYGTSHIDPAAGTNITNTDLYQPELGPNKIMNAIPRTLQDQLRKKKIQFPHSDAYLKSIKSSSYNAKNTTGVAIATKVPTATKDTITTSDEPPMEVNVELELVKEESTTSEHQAINEVGVVSAILPRPLLGPVPDGDIIKLKREEKKQIDFRDKLYLAPLTTVGNLPFRRVCKRLGVDITCSEMALSINLLQGQQSEWALLKRHHTEDLFGVQVCGSFPDTMTKCAELISNQCSVDFIDINTGCPIDLVFKKGAGCALMQRKGKYQQIVSGMSQVLDVPLTVKMRTGVYDKNWTAHKLIPELREWGASLVTIHGRSREQRYTKLADWEYIDQCAVAADPIPVFGNGDILSFEDYNSFRQRSPHIAGTMIARGALIKPWIFTEIKEQRHWDISSSERLDIVKEYAHYGLEHWGSDTQGVERTRRFLLEWLSFLHRYIPYGLLEVAQKLNERPPYFVCRDDMETLLASKNCKDWIKISEMFLGPIPDNFEFLPKHKANSYS